MLNEKEFWKSKEFWFFVFMIGQAVISLFGYGDFTPTEDQTEIVQVVISMVGLILRLFFTEKRLVLSRR